MSHPGKGSPDPIDLISCSPLPGVTLSFPSHGSQMVGELVSDTLSLICAKF